MGSIKTGKTGFNIRAITMLHVIESVHLSLHWSVTCLQMCYFVTNIVLLLLSRINVCTYVCMYVSINVLRICSRKKLVQSDLSVHILFSCVLCIRYMWTTIRNLLMDYLAFVVCLLSSHVYGLGMPLLRFLFWHYNVLLCFTSHGPSSLAMWQCFSTLTAHWSRRGCDAISAEIFHWVQARGRHAGPREPEGGCFGDLDLIS